MIEKGLPITLIIIVLMAIIAMFFAPDTTWNLTLMNGESITVTCDSRAEVLSKSGYLEYRCGKATYMVTYAEKIK